MVLIAASSSTTEERFSHALALKLLECESTFVYSECGWVCIAGYTKHRTRLVFAHCDSWEQMDSILMGARVVIGHGKPRAMTDEEYQKQAENQRKARMKKLGIPEDRMDDPDLYYRMHKDGYY